MQPGWQILSAVVAVFGLGLGIWNRIEQWRELRRKRDQERPYFVATITGPDNEGWRRLQIAWFNPGNVNFTASRITIIRPRNGKLSPRVREYGKEASNAEGRSLPVTWRIEARHDPSPPHKQVSSGMMLCQVDPGSRPLVRIDVQIVSAGRPSFPIYARPNFNTEKPEVTLRGFGS